MSIGAIGGTPSTSAYQQTSSQQSNWQTILAAASSALNLSPSALQQRLQSGQSLSSVAKTEGVSQTTLVSAISTALTQNGNLSNASSSQISQLATDIANRTRGGHHHHHHGGGDAGAIGSSTDGSSTATATGSTTATAPTVSSTTTDPLLTALQGNSSASADTLLSALTQTSTEASSLLASVGRAGGGVDTLA